MECSQLRAGLVWMGLVPFVQGFVGALGLHLEIDVLHLLVVIAGEAEGDPLKQVIGAFTVGLHCAS